jgi:16S rRNA (cytosine1402-N4)-methyltransferase
MSPPHQRVTAQMILNTASEKELATILLDYGQEFKARRIAKALVEKRKGEPFKTTKQLADLIENLMGWKKKGIHPATKVFQALRIVVNRELDNIKAFLPAALRVLKPGGNLVCISFHSLEDRMVKQFFRDHTRNAPLVEILTPKVVIPTDEEIAQNPSSRSSKLRAAKKK